MCKEKSDQLGGRFLVIAGLKIVNPDLCPILAQGAHVYLKAVLVRIMRLEPVSPSQTNVADPKPAPFFRLPFSLDEKEKRLQDGVSILTAAPPGRSIYVVTRSLRCLGEHEKPRLSLGWTSRTMAGTPVMQFGWSPGPNLQTCYPQRLRLLSAGCTST